MQDDDFITRENKFMHIKYDNFALTFFTHHTMYLPSRVELHLKVELQP